MFKKSRNFAHKPQKDGSIYLLLSKQTYSPSEQINGTIEMDLGSDHGDGIIYLELIGTEYVQWWSETEYVGDQGVKKNNYKVHKADHRIFKYKWPVSDGNKQFFQQGEYTVPFSLILPEKMASSYKYDWAEFMRPCFAKIEYKLKVKFMRIDSKFEEQLFYRSLSEIYIRQTNDGMMTRRKYKNSHQLRTCCLSNGKINFKSCVEKSEFKLGENISLKVDIKNKAWMSIKRFEVKIVQVLSLRTYHNSIVKKDTLVSKIYPGIKRRKSQSGENARVFELNLDNIDTSNAGAFTNISIASSTTTHGFLIDCDYFQEVRSIPNVMCMCCVCFHEDPMFSQPFYLYNAKSYGNNSQSMSKNRDSKIFDHYIASLDQRFEVNIPINKIQQLEIIDYNSQEEPIPLIDKEVLKKYRSSASEIILESANELINESKISLKSLEFKKY